MRLFLVGPRACGKTTVGRALSERLGLSFADTDDLVATLSGALAADLLRSRGEAALRAVESVVVDRLCEGPDRVVATGGGVVLLEKNRGRMRGAGFVVYLRADAGTLAARIRAAGAEKRPSLTGEPPDAEVGEVLAVREPLYAAAANVEVDATRPVGEVVAAILAALPAGSRGPAPRPTPPPAGRGPCATR